MKIRVDENIIYVWVSPDRSIVNTAVFPFLNQAISHAIPERRIYFLVHDLNPVLDAYYQNLQAQFEEKHLPIKIYHLRHLFNEEPLLKKINQLLRQKYLAAAIDSAKILVGANLDSLNLSHALLADFNCYIPPSLEISTDDTCTIFPFIEKHASVTYREDTKNINAYIENSYCFVIGGKNLVFQAMRLQLLSKLSTVLSTESVERTNSAVYRIYVETSLKHFFDIPYGQDLDILSDQHRTFSQLPQAIQSKLLQLEHITHERSYSWKPKAVPLHDTSLPLLLKAGHYFMTRQEAVSLFVGVCHKRTELLPLLNNLLFVKKWDCNEPLNVHDIWEYLICIWKHHGLEGPFIPFDFNTKNEECTVIHMLLSQIGPEDSSDNILEILDMSLKAGFKVDSAFGEFLLRLKPENTSIIWRCFELLLPILLQKGGFTKDELLKLIEEQIQRSENQAQKSYLEGLRSIVDKVPAAGVASSASSNFFSIKATPDIHAAETVHSCSLERR